MRAAAAFARAAPALACAWIAGATRALVQTAVDGCPSTYICCAHSKNAPLVERACWDGAACSELSLTVFSKRDRGEWHAPIKLPELCDSGTSLVHSGPSFSFVMPRHPAPAPAGQRRLLPRVDETELKELCNEVGEDFDQFVCPLSYTVMREPVVNLYGKTYDRESVVSHLRSKGKSAKDPLTNQAWPLTGTVPDEALRERFLNLVHTHAERPGLLIPEEEEDAKREFRRLVRKFLDHEEWLSFSPGMLYTAPFDPKRCQDLLLEITEGQQIFERRLENDQVDQRVAQIKLGYTPAPTDKALKNQDLFSAYSALEHTVNILGCRVFYAGDFAQV